MPYFQFLHSENHDIMNNCKAEKGVSLIEVLIALAIMMLATMASGALVTSSLISARASSLHFSIDQLSSEMIETLRAHPVDAAAGAFDWDSESSAAGSANTIVQSWNNRVADAISSGEGGIVCNTISCDVTISWLEEIDGTNHRQIFLTRTPL